MGGEVDRNGGEMRRGNGRGGKGKGSEGGSSFFALGRTKRKVGAYVFEDNKAGDLYPCGVLEVENSLRGPNPC